MTKTLHVILRNLGLCAVVSTLTLSASAADQRWVGSSALWNATANWSGGALPAATDLAIFNNLSTGNLSNLLGQSFSIKGLVYSNQVTAVSVNVTTNIHVLTLGASGVDMASAANNLTLAAPAVLGAAQTWAIATNRTLTVSRPLSGSGNLIKDLPGTLSLTGTNTFTGTLTVNSGRLQVGSTGALGNASSPLIVNSGGQMNWGASYALNKSYQVSGTGLTGDGVLRAGGNSTSTLNGNVTLLADSLALKMDGGSSFTLNGTIVVTDRNLTITLDGTAVSTVNGGVMLGTGSFTKANGSTLTLTSSTNSWSGGSTISGTLNIGNGGAASIGTGAIANSGTLTFNSSTPLQINDVISGTGSLNQNGAGLLTLAGANTYSGNTTIGTAGRLVLADPSAIPNSYANTLTVNGLLDVTAGAGTYTLGSAQTLAGSGTVMGNVTASGGTTVTGTQTIGGNLVTSAGTRVLPGGAAYGTITVAGNLSLNSPTITYDLSSVSTEGSGVNDELVTSGNLILSGTTTIVLNFRSGSLAPGSYKLIRYAGVKLGTGTFALDQAYAGLSVDTSSTPGYVLLVVSATPPTLLTWVGDSANNFWDIGVTADWSRGAGAVTFQQLNSVRFDDTGSTYPPVSLTGNLQPSVVTVDASTSYTFAGSGKLTGGASLVKANTGTLTIQTMTNDYTGPTIVQQGTLSIQDVGVFPAAGGVNIAPGAVLSFGPAGTVNFGSTDITTVSGGGTFQTYSGLTCLGGQGNTSYKVNMKLSAGALIDVTGGTLRNGGWQGGFWTDGLTWTNLADLSVAGTFDVWDGNPVYVNKLDGNGSVGTGMNAGTKYLYVGANNGDGYFGGTVACNLTGATNTTLVVVKIGSGTQYIERFTRGAGGGGTPTVNANGGTLTLGGTQDNVSTSATVNSGGILELAKNPSTAAIHALGNTLTVNSNGLVKLNGPGGDQIYNGVSVTVNQGGLIDLNGQSEAVNALNGAGAVDSTGGDVTLILGAMGGSGTFSGTLTNSSGLMTLIKTNSGTQTMLGSNFFCGGGILVVSNILQFGNGTFTGHPIGDVGLVNPVNVTSTQLRFVAPSNTTVVYNGNITNGPAPGGGNLYVDATNANIILGGVNTFAGNVTVRAGNLWIKNSSGLGIGTKLIDLTAGTIGNPSLHLDGSGGNINLDGTLSYSTSAYVTGAIVNEAGDNTIGGPINVTSGGGDTGIYVNGGTLTLTGAITPNTTARYLRIGGAGNGTVGSGGAGFIADGASPLSGLRKLDAGTWTLNGNNAYSGTTTIEGGTLVIGESGTLPLTTSITIFSNATLNVAAVTGGFAVRASSTLNGAGAVVGSLATADGVTVNPGTKGTVGTFAFGNNLTLTATTTNYFDLGANTTIGGSVNDLITVGGNLDPKGAVIYVTFLAPPAGPGTYRLFNYSGSLLSSFNATVLGGDSRYTLTLDESVPNEINLIVSGTASSLTWYGDMGTNTWNVAGAAPWAYNTEKFYNADSVTFDDTGATNIATLVGTLLPVSVTANNAVLSYTLQGTGKISGNAGISKTGAGSLKVSTANDFTGPVDVSEGSLIAGNATAFGATNAGVNIASGAVLDVNGQNLGAEPVVATGVGIGGNGAIINSGASQLNALRYVTLTGDTLFAGTNRWDIRGSNTADPTTAGLSTGGNPFNLVVSNFVAHALVGAAVDPALANVDVQRGILSYEAATTSLGNPANTLTIWPNATLTMYNATNQLNKLIVLNGGTNAALNNGAGANTIIGPITLKAASLVSVAGTSLTLNGPISETTPSAITKSGANLLALGATNTYSGGTYVAAGTLQLGNGGVGGNAGTGAITNDNGTLQFNRSDDFTWSTTVTGTNGTWTKINTNVITFASGTTNSALRTGTGIIQINGGAVILPAQSALISGGELWVAQNAGTGACIVNGGTIVASNWIAVGRNASNAVGTLIINSGTVVKTGTAGNVSVGSVGGNGTVTVNGGAFFNNSALYLGENATGVGVLNLNGGLVQCTLLARQNAASRSSIANFNGGTLLAYTNTASFIAVSNANVQAGGLILDDGGFLITNSQPLLADASSPGGGLTKKGAGVLVLNSTNTYTGPTVVANGALAGSGIVAGSLVIQSGAMLSPGNSIGALTVNGNLTYEPGAWAAMQINPETTTCDRVVGLNRVTYGGTLALTVLGSAPLADGQSFRLFYAASYSGSFSSIEPATPGTGLVWDTSALATVGTIRIKASSVPPVVSGVKVLPDGNVGFTLTGVIGQPYSVRIATNITTPLPWPVLYSGAIPTVPYVFQDLTATNYQERFYIISTP